MRIGLRCGRDRGTSRSCGINSSRSTSRPSCRRSRAGAAGRIARRRSIGRCFPGYCFARFDPRERLPVLKCTGVVSIISFEGEPAPIPEHEIDGIRRLVESDLAYDPCPMIREGMMVEVVHGPLKGVVGRLVRKNDKARLVLSVDLIGQAVSVEVDAADVRPY